MFKIILIIPKRNYDLKILFILKKHLRPFLIPKGQYAKNGLYGLKNTLNSEGTQEIEKGEGLVNISRRREERGKTNETSTVNFGV